jgi:alpha-tubulin suppressor-like RCC1 family protein
MKQSQQKNNGFVLATMIILSTVMLIIGVTILQTIISIASTYNDSYYTSVATQAGEAGILLANSCVNGNDHQQSWTPSSNPSLDKSLRQNTDCSGNPISGTRPNLLDEPTVRSSFVVGDLVVRVDGVIIIAAKGVVETKDASGAWKEKKRIVVNQMLTWDTNYSGGATSSGYKRTCGIVSGNAYCWGEENQYGQLGDGTTNPSSTPVKVVKENGVLLGQTSTAISSGLGHNCVISGGKLYCWGNNAYGQLGVGDQTQRSKPVEVKGALLNKTVTDMATSSFSTCAIADNSLYCWGRNQVGQLGIGSTQNKSTPTLVSGVLAGKSVTMLSSSGAGAEATCAVADSAVYCWGKNGYGQLGNGTRTDSNVPVAVINTLFSGKTITSLTSDAAWDDGVAPYGQTSFGHSCAVANNQAYCWGSNRFGEMGWSSSSTAQYVTQPTAVITSVMSGSVTEIIAGAFHTCALSDAKVYCWGSSSYGQLGNGVSTSGSSSKVPVLVTPDPSKNGPDDFKNISLTRLGGGFNRSCAVYKTRTFCWGNNGDGQIGDGTSGNLNPDDAKKPYPTESTFLRPKAPIFLF